jgi:3-oxoacyl-[acyl-carrier protein] reductase
MMLRGRVALVTGAGRGIGRAIAVALSAAGANLVLAARSRAELEQTATQTAAPAASCLTVPADMASSGDIDQLVKIALERFGQIDLLVNNAGIQGPIGPLVKIDEQEWMHTLDVDLMGPVRCMRRVLPGMIARRSGKIVNVAGGGATAPRPCFSAYAAAKVALVRVTETVAEEVRPYNVQVNAIAPGAVNTQMLEAVLRAGEAAGKELEAARRQQRNGGTPPELAAQLVVFLASESSGALTGKLISAPHDGWKDWTPQDLQRLSEKPWLTLRRLDEYTMNGIQDHLTRKINN